MLFTASFICPYIYCQQVILINSYSIYSGLCYDNQYMFKKMLFGNQAWCVVLGQLPLTCWVFLCFYF